MPEPSGSWCREMVTYHHDLWEWVYIGIQRMVQDGVEDDPTLYTPLQSIISLAHTGKQTLRSLTFI